MEAFHFHGSAEVLRKRQEFYGRATFLRNSDGLYYGRARFLWKNLASYFQLSSRCLEMSLAATTTITTTTTLFPHNLHLHVEIKLQLCLCLHAIIKITFSVDKYLSY